MRWGKCFGFIFIVCFYVGRCAGSLSEVVNFAKYSLDPTTQGYDGLVSECRVQIKERGYVHLPDFVFVHAAKALAEEATMLAQRPETFKSFGEHNVFLCEEPEEELSSFSSTHPRRVKFRSSKTVVNANQILSTSALALLFSLPALQLFVKDVLQEDTLFESFDPVGKFYYNIFSPGDALGWHFDNSLFSVSLILQPCDEGGDFRYWPDSRSNIEEWSEWNESSAKQNAIIPEQRSGTLYLFRGNQALHSVSSIERGTRINAIFTYNSQPNVMLSPYTRKKFFGTEGGNKAQASIDSTCGDSRSL